MPLDLKKDSMGDVIKDFYKSKSHNLKAGLKKREERWQLLQS